MPDEPRRRRRAVVEHRAASRTPSGRRSQGRAVWLDVAPGDKVMQIENDYEKGSTTAEYRHHRRQLFNSRCGRAHGRFDGRPSHTDLANWTCWCPPSAATIHKSPGFGISAVIIRCSPSITPCSSGTCSIPASRAAKSWLYWSDRRRGSPSRSVTCRGGGGGRSSASGCGQNRLPHDSLAWRVEPGSQWTFLKDPQVRQRLDGVEPTGADRSGQTADAVQRFAIKRGTGTGPARASAYGPFGSVPGVDIDVF